MEISVSSDTSIKKWENGVLKNHKIVRVLLWSLKLLASSNDFLHLSVIILIIVIIKRVSLFLKHNKLFIFPITVWAIGDCLKGQELKFFKREQAN